MTSSFICTRTRISKRSARHLSGDKKTSWLIHMAALLVCSTVAPIKLHCSQRTKHCQSKKSPHSFSLMSSVRRRNASSKSSSVAYSRPFVHWQVNLADWNATNSSKRWVSRERSVCLKIRRPSWCIVTKWPSNRRPAYKRSKLKPGLNYLDLAKLSRTMRPLSAWLVKGLMPSIWQTYAIFHQRKLGKFNSRKSKRLKHEREHQ